MTKLLRVAVTQCRGSAYEVGRQMAAGFLATPRGRAFGRRRERKPFAFSFANARATLETWAPNIWEELHGIADGLAIPLERAVAEYSNGRLRFPRRGCTAVIAAGLYGRNYDFNIAHYDRWLAAIQPRGVHASLGFVDRFTGRLDGINEQGLCVGLHRVNERTWQPGLVCVLIVRMVLDQCATTHEAVALLRRIPHGLGFNYSLLDAAGHAAVVEASPAQVAVREGPWLACTNHFQAASMQPYNPRKSGHSRGRLPPLEAWAGQAPGAAALFRNLNESRSPAFFHNYAAGAGTLHTLVAEPATRIVHLGIGGDAAPTRLDFADWTRGADFGLAFIEGQLGGTSRPFDPSRRVRAPAGAEGGGVSRMFINANLANAVFADVSLKQSNFTKVDLAQAQFDHTSFANAHIAETCDITGLKIAGVAIKTLLDAWQSSSGGPRRRSASR